MNQQNAQQKHLLKRKHIAFFTKQDNNNQKSSMLIGIPF